MNENIKQSFLNNNLGNWEIDVPAVNQKITYSP